MVSLVCFVQLNTFKCIWYHWFVLFNLTHLNVYGMFNLTHLNEYGLYCST